MMMSLEATTSEEAGENAVLMNALPENPLRLEFRIRKQEN
jgi:hypothetical protein